MSTSAVRGDDRRRSNPTQSRLSRSALLITDIAGLQQSSAALMRVCRMACAIGWLGPVSDGDLVPRNFPMNHNVVPIFIKLNNRIIPTRFGVEMKEVVRTFSPHQIIP